MLRYSLVLFKGENNTHLADMRIRICALPILGDAKGAEETRNIPADSSRPFQRKESREKKERDRADSLLFSLA